MAVGQCSATRNIWPTSISYMMPDGASVLLSTQEIAHPNILSEIHDFKRLNVGENSAVPTIAYDIHIGSTNFSYYIHKPSRENMKSLAARGEHLDNCTIDLIA